jgi:D-lactate dehydrogenase
MKDGVFLVNTSRGGLVDTQALNDGLSANKFTGVALDVYEEEDEYFFEDRSNDIIKDEELIKLMAYPNVLITSHQAFFTNEALEAIARTSYDNLKAFIDGAPLENEVKYQAK